MQDTSTAKATCLPETAWLSLSQRQNPANITTLKDLAKPGIKLVLAAASVPVRDYTNTMVDKLAADASYGADFKTAFYKNVVSEEDNVRQVSAKVALGEADAGVVYYSDVTPDIAGKSDPDFKFPDSVNTLATYPIGILKESANKDLAQKFIDYVLSSRGQESLNKWNFYRHAAPICWKLHSRHSVRSVLVGWSMRRSISVWMRSRHCQHRPSM